MPFTIHSKTGQDTKNHARIYYYLTIKAIIDAHYGIDDISCISGCNLIWLQYVNDVSRAVVSASVAREIFDVVNFGNTISICAPCVMDTPLL